MERLHTVTDAGVPSPVCRVTLRGHAFRAFHSKQAQCHDCGLVMPLAAALRDGADARHCLTCGWWSPEDDCRAGAWCVWCKAPFDD